MSDNTCKKDHQKCFKFYEKSFLNPRPCLKNIYLIQSLGIILENSLKNPNFSCHIELMYPIFISCIEIIQKDLYFSALYELYYSHLISLYKVETSDIRMINLSQLSDFYLYGKNGNFPISYKDQYLNTMIPFFEYIFKSGIFNMDIRLSDLDFAELVNALHSSPNESYKIISIDSSELKFISHDTILNNGKRDMVWRSEFALPSFVVLMIISLSYEIYEAMSTTLSKKNLVTIESKLNYYKDCFDIIAHKWLFYFLLFKDDNRKYFFCNQKTKLSELLLECRNGFIIDSA
jgi:hypothetical protein